MTTALPQPRALFRGNPRARQQRVRDGRVLEPSADGQKMRIRFPADMQTLDELEQWLAEHPRASMFVLDRLPLNPFVLVRLVKMQRRHGVAMLISPYLSARDLR